MRLQPKLLAAGLASLLMMAGPAFAQGTTAAPAAPITTPAKTAKPAMAAPAAKHTAAGKPALTGPVNINTATATDLDALPQIGPKRAAKIVNGRPYKTTEDLVAKKVLSAGIYAKIKDKIVAN